MSLELKGSKVQALLSEIVFRHNQETNTRYTTANVPADVLTKRAKLPTFPLNALNYLPILINLHTASASQLLKQFAEPCFDTFLDEYSFWLVEVPVDEFFPIYDELTQSGIDLDTVDPKLKGIFDHYQEFTSLGIHTKDDLVKAMQSLQ